MANPPQMYFDRPTVFATDVWCREAVRRPPAMTRADFVAAVRARAPPGALERWPDVVRDAFRDVPERSSREEYDLAVRTAVRALESRQSYARELERRSARPLGRNVPMRAMERRANGE